MNRFHFYVSSFSGFVKLSECKENDVKVAALLGTAQHAINQVKAGVDILVVSGTEAGGHCGSVSTMVLIPEVYEAIQPSGDVPILAAGYFVTFGDLFYFLIIKK